MEIYFQSKNKKFFYEKWADNIDRKRFNMVTAQIFINYLLTRNRILLFLFLKTIAIALKRSIYAVIFTFMGT